MTTSKLATFSFLVSIALSGSVSFATCWQEGQAEAKDQATKASKVSVDVKVESNKATLSPENTIVRFVGTHVGDDPKPRVGGFKKFSGEIKVNDSGAVDSISFKFDIKSMWTEFPKLTTHLMTADFFDVEKYTSAKFESSKVEAIDGGKIKVTGQLNLMGESKEISFVATSRIENKLLSLRSEFKIDRTMFGMDKMQQGVEKPVSISIEVGARETNQHAVAMEETKVVEKGIVGKWQLTFETPGGEMRPIFEVTKGDKEGDYVVTFEERDNATVKNVVFEDGVLSFDLEVDYDGQALSTVYDLKLKGDELSGILGFEFKENGQSGELDVVGDRLK